MSKRSFSLNIFHKLLMTLLLVALVPLFTVWYAGSAQARRDATVTVNQNLTMTATTIANGINSWDDANVRVLQQAARLDDIIGMNAAKQTSILRAMGDTYEWAFVVFTADPLGDGVARSDDKGLVKYGDRSYFQASMKGEVSSRQVLISKSTGKPALTLSVPIRNGMGGPVGVIAMAMKLDDISKVIKDTRIGETGYAVLLDAENKMIASGMPDKSKDAVQDMSGYASFKVEGISDLPTVYLSNGKKVVGYVRKLPQGWSLLVEQDYAEAYASLERLETAARIFILLTGALVAGVAYAMGKALTRPINQLIVVAEQLSTGQFSDEIPGTERGDEIGALARAIERLGVSIRMAMDRLRKKA